MRKITPMKFVPVDCLWKCETCANCKEGKCADHVWCEHGEQYRPQYDKLTIVEGTIVEDKHENN